MKQIANKELSKDLFEVVNNGVGQNEVIARPSLTYWQDVKRRLFKNKGATVGLIIVIILALLAIFGPYMTGHNSADQDLSRAKVPPKIPVLENVSFLPFNGLDKDGKDVYAAKGITEYFWFGTDDLGRDLWTRTWEGTRVSLAIALLAAAVDMFIGVAYGGISGFYGGRTDTIMQRIAEVLAGIPFLIVVILFILVFEPGILTIALAMVITGWISMSRIVRGQVLKLKSQEYVLASRTLGASNTRLITKHLVPNVLGPIIIMTMFTIPSAIFTEAFLSYIGLGLKAPLASLGTLVSDGQKALQTNPYMLFIPATVISLLILSFNLLADGLRDALDPKMRK
ncbi:oligopeptide transport system permease protein [Priestia taiwanensis]|uniref:Peptide ABC transporter permease n=2 Tax=Priestia taiwanensis TaxID=1347902 RepID=A0A917EQL6_9BACI|nr:oligopeptide ABC transporter permease [Priestia taiwanensis]MBM7364166.1 oligopeptide transport system permease protein [Priestia taiwanensis]GGE72143.1 peptide ABC transporter permease [Priestia taiwanensis]